MSKKKAKKRGKPTCRYTARELVVAAAREGIRIDMQKAREVLRSYYRRGAPKRNNYPCSIAIYTEACRNGANPWIIK